MAKIVYPKRASSGFESDELKSLGRRSSALFNDDDFDYAIELRPDDEYRKAAEELPDIVDFDEIEIDPTDLLSSEGSFDEEDDYGHLAIANKSPFISTPHITQPNHDLEASIPHRPSLPEITGRRSSAGLMGTFYYDHTITGIGTSPINTSPNKLHRRQSDVSRHSLVTKREFSMRLKMLGNHRKWVEKAARKSSIGFSNRFHVNAKDAMDRFLVCLARGVTVRRHQAYKLAESVRLFSTTGCREICWERPRKEAEKKSSLGKADRGVFDWCIAICGCGDDLTGEKDLRELDPSSDENGVDSIQANEGGLLQCLTNIGFKRSGKFEDLSIIAVHGAEKEDPTAPGMFGTESLRRSKDTFNTELTFSIIINDSLSSLGYNTLDIECDETELYYTLLQGFKELLKEAQKRRSGKESNPKIAEPSEVWRQMWNNAKEAITTKRKKTLDPVSDLFAPSSSLDPFRAIRVGGGLIPSHSPTNENSSSNTGLVPVAQFLGWNSAGTQIWARLKMAGLDVKCVFSWELSRVILKIKCPTWRLEQMAEQMRIKVKGRDGYMKPFRVLRRDSFVPFGARGNIFRSSERQQIIDYILRSKIQDGGADLDEHTELGSYIVQRFPLHMYGRLVEIRHSWVTFWKREPPGQTAPGWSMFQASYSQTCQNWLVGTNYFFSNLLTQPLDNIAEYFGEGVAFYFAFMAFYTRWLVFPSILGVIVFAVQISTGVYDHIICSIYAVVIMIWISFMLAFWRQKQSALAYKWGVLDYEVEETERPQFQGKYYEDDLTGEVHKHYPMYKRFFRYLITIPVICAAIFLILLIMLTVFYSQDKLYSDYVHRENIDLSPSLPSMPVMITPFSAMFHSLSSSASNNTVPADTRTISMSQLADPEFWSVTFFYPSLYGILVSILNHVFEAIAIYLNEFENHRTQTTFINRLILKVFCFQFITIFTSLYYYLFFTQNHQAAFTRIAITIFSLMTVGTWWNLVMDIYLPQLYHRTLMYRMRANIAVNNRKVYAAREMADTKGLSDIELGALEETVSKRVRYLDQAKSTCWEEALYRKYNNFTDYTTLVIQLSYILFFSAIFPLAPLLALFNNVILIRCQAYKICYTRQRPIATKIGGIGIWSNVLQLLSMLGVLTNCALFGLVSDPIRQLAEPVGSTGLAVGLFVYEQVVLLFKYWLHTQVPSISPTVKRAQIRERKSVSRKSAGREKVQREKEREKEKERARRHNSFMNMWWHREGGGGGGGVGCDAVDGSRFYFEREEERGESWGREGAEEGGEEGERAGLIRREGEYEEKEEESEGEGGGVWEEEEGESEEMSPPPYSPPRSPMGRKGSVGEERGGWREEREREWEEEEREEERGGRSLFDPPFLFGKEGESEEESERDEGESEEEERDEERDPAPGPPSLPPSLQSMGDSLPRKRSSLFSLFTRRGAKAGGERGLQELVPLGRGGRGGREGKGEKGAAGGRGGRGGRGREGVEKESKRERREKMEREQRKVREERKEGEEKREEERSPPRRGRVERRPTLRDPLAPPRAPAPPLPPSPAPAPPSHRPAPTQGGRGKERERREGGKACAPPVPAPAPYTPSPPRPPLSSPFSPSSRSTRHLFPPSHLPSPFAYLTERERREGQENLPLPNAPPVPALSPYSSPLPPTGGGKGGKLRNSLTSTQRRVREERRKGEKSIERGAANPFLYATSSPRPRILDFE